MIIDREPFSAMTVPAGLRLGILKPIIFFHWPKIQSYSQHGGDPVKPVNEPCFSQAQGALPALHPACHAQVPSPRHLQLPRGFADLGTAQQCSQCQNVSPVLGHFMAQRSWQCGGLTCNEVLCPRVVWQLKETRSLSLSLYFLFFPLLHSSPPESTKGLKPVEACLSSEFL